jgi:histidinol-phosphate aminotransferase
MTMIDPRARTVVRTLKSYTPGGRIEDAKRALKRSTVIKLASNENALGPSPKAVAALKSAAKSLNRYPDAACRELRVRLAKRLRVDPEMLIVGNGSDELIVLALRAFVDPGDEVVVAQPTFLIYELQAAACGAAVTVVPLKQYRYDLSAMLQAVTPHTRLVFIANPDNPTGTYVTARELEAFLSRIPPEVIVFIDEAYYEFADARDYPQTVHMTSQRSLIVSRTFSKAYGLAGLRVGYGIARPEILAALNVVREPFNVNSLAQAAAVAALDDASFLVKTQRMVREGRAYLTGELDHLKVRHIPSLANFVLLELGPNAPEVADALLKQGVMVREMSAWKLPHCIRVTIGTKEENRKFIQALRKCLTR